MNTSDKQLLLELTNDVSFNEKDYFVSGCNEDAYNLIHEWPNWKDFALLIYGAKGSGKSHLANIWAKISKAKILNCSFLSLGDIEESKHYKSFVLENYDKIKMEETFLELFNSIKKRDSSMLLVGLNPPKGVNFLTKDLESRIRSLYSVEIGLPDDILLKTLLLKQFSDRQVKIEKTVIDFIIPRIDRSFDAVVDIVNKIDKYSLRESRKITIPLVKTVIEGIEDAHI
jgi:chromosomal replication initiation ATPase DnaA